MPRVRKRKSVRLRLREIFDPYTGPPQSRWSLHVDVLILAAILCSCVLVVLELQYGAGAPPHLIQAFYAAEIGFTSVFVIEYLLRWYAAPSRLRYPLTFFAVVDLVAVLPSVLMLLEGWGLGAGFLALRIFRGIRLLRVLRLLRLLRFLRYGYTIFRLLVNVRIWCSAVVYHYRLGRLGRLLLWVIIAWLVGTNVLYATEYLLHDAAAPSPYASSYWLSYWNVIIMLISGMDTDSPMSLPGRIEVALLLIAGICVVGMFTGELVSILVRSAQRSGLVALKPPTLRLDQHIVIIGRNRQLESIISQIYNALGGHHYILVVAHDAGDLRAPPGEMSRRVFALAGDPTRADVLDAANIDQALRVVVLAAEHGSASPRERDNKALMRALAVAARSRSVPLVVELSDEESLTYAGVLCSAECLITQHLGERLISQAVVTPGVTKVYDELMTLADSNELFTVPVPAELVGQTFQQAQELFLDHEGEDLVLVGLDGMAQPFEDFELGPEQLAARTLEAGDRLIVMAYERPSFARVSNEDLWTGRILVRG